MSSKSIDFDDIFWQTGRLRHEFTEEEEPIGAGSYGIVTRAKHKIDNKEYAIKKMIIKDLKTTIRERQVWAKLDTDFFVQYRSSWVEHLDEPIHNQFRRYSYLIEDREGTNTPPLAVLHIQMDLCSFSLKYALEQMRKSLDVRVGQLMPPLGYYISSELLIEILDCIQFLHKMEPPILHRDINPNNILIKRSRDGRFVKISDFGGAVEHLSDDQTHSRLFGTQGYMAPEVINGTKYNTSADVYSIAVMALEMFNLDINTFNTLIPVDGLGEFVARYQALRLIIASAMDGHSNDRPSCEEWLGLKTEWALDSHSVRQLIASRIDVNKEYDIKEDFVNHFLKTKTMIIDK